MRPARSPLPPLAPEPAPAALAPVETYPEPPAARERTSPVSGLYAGHLLGVFSIALSNVLLGLTVLAAVPALRGRRSPVPWRRLALLTVPLGLYVLLLFGAIAASVDPDRSLDGAAEVFGLATLLLGPLLLRGERPVRRLVDGLAILAVLLAGWGLAQYLLGYGDIDRRIRGPFSHYMTFSGFLLIADLLLAAAVLTGRHGRWRWRWAALALVNAAVVGSLTRGAWVALIPALVLLVLVRRPRLLAWALPAALWFALLAPVPLLHRVGSIFDLRDSSNYDRLCMAEAGMRMVAERPLFGLGPNMVKTRYPIYRSPTAPRYRIPHLHNNLLQIAAERGLPAVGAYLALFAGSFWVAWRSYRREGGGEGPRADLHLGVMLALFAFNVAGLFENNWGDTEVQRVMLFVLAIPHCLALRYDPTPSRPSSEEDAPSAPESGTAVAGSR